MKKRIISVLLLCCIVLGLLPTTTFANNGGAKAIQLGTSGISGYDSTNSSYDYIHFGTWNNSTVKWRVLDTKTNMANAREGDGFFLLSDVLLGRRLRNVTSRINTAFFVTQKQITPHRIWYNRVD